jgi:hypothetical protein
MKKHLKYIKYLARHKFYVGQEAFKRGLYLRAFVHDYDKFFPSRWRAYANFFYTSDPTPEVSEEFRIAWRRHWQMNEHHWQWWISIHDDGKIRPHEMSEKARTEMLCDWIGAHKAVRGKSLLGWFNEREATILIAPKTKRWLKQELIKLDKEQRND